MSSHNEPLIVLLHGGYWREQHGPEHLEPLAQVLRGHGFEVALPEYRRKAGDPYVTTTDVNTIIKTFSDRNVILVGYSVGGQLALLSAPLFSNIKAILALAPVTDLLKTEEAELGDGATKEWLPNPAVEYPDLDPMRSEVPPLPIIFIHGDIDVRVPLSTSISYVEKAKHDGKDIELITLKGVGHFDLIDPANIAMDSIVKSLKKLSNY
jgi:acetyl esterase/lipase